MNEKRSLFGIDIDAVRMSQAVDCLRSWIEDDSASCRFVVTPNVDHMVMLRENQGFREAYAAADLILADGHPIVWASQLLRRPLPERVPGSELVPALFESFNQKGTLRVFLLGAAIGVAERAARNMKRQWPNVETVGLYSPPLGFEKSDAETNCILQQIGDCCPDVVVVGFGAPKQELWVHKHAAGMHANVALCVGATIDFIAGEKKRAPVWMQKCGTEWLHRMVSEPRRLLMRYAKDAWIFPQIVFQQMISQSR